MTYVFERLDLHGNDNWAEQINAFPGRTVCQTPAWLAFLTQTQNAQPVIAVLKEGRRTVGYFTGLIIRKYGLQILGSPFPGWTTDYMGLTLSAGASRRRAVQALVDFAFDQLGCVHLEIMDRNLRVEDVSDLTMQHRRYRSFEVDLTQSEHELFARMSGACRRCIRKAEKNGVRIEAADDLAFADEYYAQLQDVFAKQSLVPPYGVERVRQLIRHLHPSGSLLLLRARDQSGRCIATGIFPHLNGVMHFWGGASWRHHQFLRPNEAVQWHAMRTGKQLGARVYDMGGGGEYKRKYGGTEIEVPWLRKSKWPWIGCARDIAQQAYMVRQQWLGHLNRFFPQNVEAKRSTIPPIMHKVSEPS